MLAWEVRSKGGATFAKAGWPGGPPGALEAALAQAAEEQPALALTFEAHKNGTTVRWAATAQASDVKAAIEQRIACIAAAPPPPPPPANGAGDAALPARAERTPKVETCSSPRRADGARFPPVAARTQQRLGVRALPRSPRPRGTGPGYTAAAGAGGERSGGERERKFAPLERRVHLECCVRVE